ncbi:hypothetical protein JZ751_013540 [Albula glossodonta]|uniref:Uncharacterized protein n=1 Tax=Albula glossodonta TaxID=121402 RepID=A0A8T2N5X7_9TELE|nr:hypothetical protein JZ751_013540 [Albula glossodonta]
MLQSQSALTSSAQPYAGTDVYRHPPPPTLAPAQTKLKRREKPLLLLNLIVQTRASELDSSQAPRMRTVIANVQPSYASTHTSCMVQRPTRTCLERDGVVPGTDSVIPCGEAPASRLSCWCGPPMSSSPPGIQVSETLLEH